MRPDFRGWLEQQKYDIGTISSRLSGARRVEDSYGDLDEQYNLDKLSAVTELLKYTKSDERSGRKNPTKLTIDGNIFNGLATYRSAVALYRRFREGAQHPSIGPDPSDAPAVQRNSQPSNNDGERIGLERDMQRALRNEITQLESGIEITDGGSERYVDSGFIDIMGRDPDGNPVVIELKAGTASRNAVAQILSYMGDVQVEDESPTVRGILVAAEFDKRAKAAARVVPNLALKRYRVRFAFSDGVE